MMDIFWATSPTRKWQSAWAVLLLQSIAILVLLLSFATVCHADFEDELSKIQTRLSTMRSQLHILNNSYNAMSKGTSKASFQRRLSDGQLNFLLKDYLRASIILFDVVEHYKKRDILWIEAAYSLAESLFFSRNYESAAKYYQRLISYKTQYASKALLRLMTIASKTQRYQWINNYFQKHSNVITGPLKNLIYYLRAKVLYQQRKYLAAKRVFSSITQGPEWIKAQYFLAVIQLQTLPRERGLQEAIQLLKGAYAVISKNKSKKNKKLHDIILLSLARLHLERKKYNDALHYYLQIDRKSHIFDRALYEICWCYIRRAQEDKKLSEAKKVSDYKNALLALDVLLDFLPDSPFYPRAQLLRSHLLLKLNRFKVALKNYQKVVKKYSVVSEEMDRQLKAWKATSTPIKVFQGLIANNLDKFNVASVLHKEAVKWMNNETLMKRTLIMLRDLRDMKKNLRDSKLIIQRLENAVKFQNQMALSSNLQEGRLKALNMRGELIKLMERLNRLERKLVFSAANEEQKKHYRKIRQYLKSLQTLFEQTPHSKQQMILQTQAFSQRIEKMKVRLHRLKLQIKYNWKFIKAARVWLSSNPEAHQLAIAQRNALANEISQIDRLNRSLEQEVRQLEQRVDLTKIRYGGASLSASDRKVQRRYQQILEEEAQFLKKIASNLSLAKREQLDRIRHSRHEARKLRAKLVQFFLLLKQLIQKHTQDIVKKVEEQKILIHRYEEAVTRLKRNAKVLAAKIAYGTFLSVRKKFKNLVLRADVGLIDVVWQEKQAVQAEHRRLSKERNSELRVLNSEFKDILQEVK